nr:porin [Caballeronia sp. INDeC2]
MGVSGSAQAQSSVVLYGIIDAGFAYTSNEAPAVGKPGEHRFRMLSGSLSGERWGLKGTEALGAGLNAIFTLENGFYSMNGKFAQGGLEFGRQAFVGLSSDRFGTVTMGRQYDFAEMIQPMLSWNQFIGPFGAHVGDNDNLYQTVRTNNSIKYQSPVVSGLTFGAIYGFSNQASGQNGVGFANNREYNFGASYVQGPLRLAASYMRLDNPSAANNTNPDGAVAANQYTLGASSIFYNYSPVARQSVVAAGGAYAFSFATLAFVYSNTTLIYGDGTRLRLRNYEINGKKFLTPSVLVGIGYTYTSGSGQDGMSIKPFASGNHPSWHQINLGAEYLLSKRTLLHVATIVQFATKDATTAAINYDGAVTGSNGYKQVSVVAGLRHTF